MRPFVYFFVGFCPAWLAAAATMVSEGKTPTSPFLWSIIVMAALGGGFTTLKAYYDIK